MKLSYKRLTCRLCGKKKLTNVFHLEPSPLPDVYVPKTQVKHKQPIFPLDLMLCKSCGQVQLDEVVYPEVIYKDYIYETVNSVGLVKHFEDFAADVMEIIKPNKGALIVDIGSNDGTLLKIFKKSGMKVLGIDPAPAIARKASGQGIETIPKYFTQNVAKQIRQKYGLASVICANNILANVDDMDEITEGIKTILSPEGIFVFESFYFPDQMKKMMFDFIYQEHLSCLTVKPVQTYFVKHGMELIDVRHIATKGGSVRYMVQLAGGSKCRKSSVAEMIRDEGRGGFHQPQVYRLFQKKVNLAKLKLTVLLNKLLIQGKIIAGYGASAATTTLIYHFKLQNAIRFILDDNENRHKLYSPGCHIPVVSKASIPTIKPDYILILAWRYVEQIVARNQEFLQNGGKFIVPLPKLKIISK
jgi:2-polyprenyl-3-methyl-5-hydroxy-6-metoxy-1,4-benzoquinol methylase